MSTLLPEAAQLSSGPEAVGGKEEGKALEEEEEELIEVAEKEEDEAAGMESEDEIEHPPWSFSVASLKASL